MTKITRIAAAQTPTVAPVAVEVKTVTRVWLNMWLTRDNVFHLKVGGRGHQVQNSNALGHMLLDVGAQARQRDAETNEFGSFPERLEFGLLVSNEFLADTGWWTQVLLVNNGPDRSQSSFVVLDVDGIRAALTASNVDKFDSAGDLFALAKKPAAKTEIVAETNLVTTAIPAGLYS